jgi:hypothetical protein
MSAGHRIDDIVQGERVEMVGRDGSQFASSVASVSRAGAAAVAQPTPDVRWDCGVVAEALTSSTADDTIEAGYRMFSLPDFADVCKAAHAADVVRVRPLQPQIRLQAGRPFDPNVLKIVALDALDVIVPRVPIAVETELWSPVLETSTPHVADGTVTPQRPGTFKLRIRTLCDGPVAEAFIDVEVVPRIAASEDGGRSPDDATRST